MNRSWIAAVLIVLLLGGAWYFSTQRGAMAKDWKDGTYVGESKRDERGGFGQTELTIKDGKITQVEYTEFSAEDTPKDDSYPYQFIFEAIPKLEEDLIEVQDPAKVDQVSGATATWNKFKEASQDALDKAK